MPAKLKSLTVKPLTSSMDSRSSPDDLDLKSWRYVRNWGIEGTKNRLCRDKGWRKLLDQEDYNNFDLHDQLLSITGDSERSPVTMLFEATSTRKSTKLYAGTHSSLFALNNGTGNWRVIAKDYGNGSTTKWKAAQSGDALLFTNNFDEPRYHLFDQGSINGEATSLIPDFVTLKITKVGTFVYWKGHIFAMNVVIGGDVKPHGVYWSNYERPLDWIPMGGSTAGSQDLDFDESIIAAAPLANRLLIYTTRGIWEAFAAGGTGPVFSFSKRYDPRDFGEACLFYPNTLVTVGDEHVYLGVDGVYLYNLFEEKPKRIEYMHRASNVIFDDINRDNCDVHIGAYDFERKRIIFSWARTGESQNSQSLAFSTDPQPFASVIDHGFTAMVNYVNKGRPKLLRDWLLENCICDEAGLNSAWEQFESEGGFCTAQEAVTCATTPGSIWTTNSKVLDADEGIETEDWEQASADADSLCTLLAGKTLLDLCEDEIRREECNSGQRFVVASSVDYCLKEFAGVFYREEATGFTGCGVYALKGYKSLLRSGAIHAGMPDEDKELHRLTVEALAAVQSTPSKFKVRIGRHGQALDPNEDNCGIIWELQPTKEIECLGGVSAAQHAAQGSVPDNGYEWDTWLMGRYFYLELEVINDAVTPPDTGGEVCLSRYTLDMKPRMAR